MRLVGERNEWYTRYMSAINNPDFMAAGEDAGPPAGTHLELDAVDGPGSYIVFGGECRIVLVKMELCCLSENNQHQSNVKKSSYC